MFSYVHTHIHIYAVSIDIHFYRRRKAQEKQTCHHRLDTLLQVAMAHITRLEHQKSFAQISVGGYCNAISHSPRQLLAFNLSFINIHQQRAAQV